MGKKSSNIDVNIALTELETIIEKIEDSELSLDESLKEFESGIRLVRQTQEALHSAEQRVSKLLEDDDGKPKLAEFELQEDLGDSE